MQQDELQSILVEALGSQARLKSTQSIGGGCINNTQKLITNRGTYFLKFNADVPADFFQKEFKNLEILAGCYPGAVPKPVHSGKTRSAYYLLCSYIDSAPKNTSYWIKLGEYLAELHRHSSDRYGLPFDNYIGRLPQNNKQDKSWISFFINKRLEPQILLAQQANLLPTEVIKKFNSLYERLENLIPVREPALIHGDLWVGNLLTDENGLPALVDPAVYYGHHEMELAFTQLFGGFEPAFMDSYSKNFKLEPEFFERMDVYNLYPLLVHVNLFGTSYLSGIKRILNRFL